MIFVHPEVNKADIVPYSSVRERTSDKGGNCVTEKHGDLWEHGPRKTASLRG